MNKSAISKSDLLLYIDCPAHLWAKKHGQYKEVISEFTQNIMEQGMEVEKIAIDHFREKYPTSQTDRVVQYQRTFTYKNFSARADILIHKPDTNTYDLYEVKSSTKVKDEHIYDAAFQNFVLSQTITLNQVYIVYVNNEYLLQEELEPDKFLALKNVTEKVMAKQAEVALLAEQAFNAAAQPTPDLLAKCLKPKDCPCPQVCHHELPEYSIFDIPRLDKKKKQQLISYGMFSVEQIPTNYPINPIQRQHIECMRHDTESIDLPKIRAELSRYEFPLYFLDYETISTAIPMFTGHKPYEQLVFQYSLHILPAPDHDFIHKEALVIGDQDPQPDIARALAADIGETGTVLAWYKHFEKGRTKGMGEQLPVYAELFQQINYRLIDLGDSFSKGYYIHPKFKGSWSIKNVLPVVSPTLSYAAMPVSNGTQAMTAYLKASDPNTPNAERDQIKKDMLAYCALDTLAMVEIYRFLLSKIK